MVKLGASFPPPTTEQDTVPQERPDPAVGGLAAGPGALAKLVSRLAVLV